MLTQLITRPTLKRTKRGNRHAGKPLMTGPTRKRTKKLSENSVWGRSYDYLS